jgi:hypothetical protein
MPAANTRLFLGRSKDLGSYTLVHAVMKFVIPNFTRNSWLALNSFLAGLVIGQWSRTSLDAVLSDLGHRINWLFVRLINTK